MKIKRKTLSKRATGAVVIIPPTTLKVGNNTYEEKDNVIEIPQTVNSITDGIETYVPNQEGTTTVPAIPRSVTVNNSTFTPDSSGDIDLGTIGGGVSDVTVNGTSVVKSGVAVVNAATRVDVNGIPYQVSANGVISLELGSNLFVKETPFGLVPWGNVVEFGSQSATSIHALSFLCRPYIYSPTSIILWRTVVSNLVDVISYSIQVRLTVSHYDFDDTTKSAHLTANVIVTNTGDTTGNNNILSFLVVPFVFSAVKDYPNDVQICLLHLTDVGSDDWCEAACYNVDDWGKINIEEPNGFVWYESYNYTTATGSRLTYSSYLRNGQNVIVADEYITKWLVDITLANDTVTAISVAKLSSITL